MERETVSGNAFGIRWAAYKKTPLRGGTRANCGFFDNYVIALGQKLEECGVFGVTSDECLLNTLENRRECGLRRGKL